MIDYQAIVDALTEDKVKEILTKLEIPYEDKGAFLLMPTYCHNHKSEDASKKLYYYKNNKIFQCYTECGAQSIFKFLKNYYDAQGYEYDWYNDIYRLIVGDVEVKGIVQPKYQSLQNRYNYVKKEAELPQYNKGVLGCFIKTYPPEWLADSISREAMDKYDIAFSISQNKIIIPHYDINGNLCGIRGRALNEEEIERYGKYAPIWLEGKCYTHPLSMNLYGLYQNKTDIARAGVCYLFESEKSVLQFESFNLPHCAVAVCGSNFNKFQLMLLLQHCKPKEIVICFDNEEVEGDKYFNKLYAIGDKYKSYANFSFIYDRNNLTPKKASPSDCGEEIFRQLLERRVIVK